MNKPSTQPPPGSSATVPEDGHQPPTKSLTWVMKWGLALTLALLWLLILARPALGTWQ